jgi:hypothetical protein
MRGAPTTPLARHRLVIATVLIVGLGAALVIYLNAGSASANPLGEPEDSKRYLREMEVYGGTANVLASELRHWFEGLWHGEGLAYTVACIAVLSSGVYWFVATRLQFDPDSDGASESHPGGTDS